MKELKNLIIILSSMALLNSCQETTGKNPIAVDYEVEKAAILECLNSETKSAFARDYLLWTEHWIHEQSISKTYINYVDSSYSESIGWNEISDFVRKFIEDHPDPEPAPKLLNDIDVRLYQNGAWVSFEQMDSLRGLKRETRLMEKVDEKWKIAGMHTTIYGFDKN